MRTRTRLALATAVLALTLQAGPAAAQAPETVPTEPPPPAQDHPAPLYQKAIDLAVIRPIGLPVTAVLGGGFWLLGAPVFWVFDDMAWWNDVCLEEPIRQYITRPLGEF